MKKYIALLIICATVVVLAGIGAWVYVQRENIKLKNAAQQLDRQTEIKKIKYQECQQNNRAAESSDSTTFRALGVKNCDLLL